MYEASSSKIAVRVYIKNISNFLLCYLLWSFFGQGVYSKIEFSYPKPVWIYYTVDYTRILENHDPFLVSEYIEIFISSNGMLLALVILGQSLLLLWNSWEASLPWEIAVTDGNSRVRVPNWSGNLNTQLELLLNEDHFS